MRKNYFSWFNVSTISINHLVQLDLTKNSQTFSVDSGNENTSTVKVWTHETYHNNLDK